MTKRNKRITGRLVGKFTEAQLREIETYEVGPFTSCPKIQPHEASAVDADRQTATMLGFNERDTEAFIKNRLMLRRQAEHIRRQEQLRAGESVSIILNPALKREYDRQGAHVGQQPFVPNAFQCAILKALDGCALKKQPLADKVCKGEGSVLYRKDGLKELRAAGLVAHKNRLGFYRPDRPPHRS